ncbi:cation-translocating P-type ATPase [Thioflexithrix psekupsensis]|uniref:Carbonate dehydratase n=1 Tax=Thioflexithrix psekupsensis TaxID=1570016 RepID=A0A251X826_9GAMM|nr:cation-transporting P-type ATPase [Thioflexithrix psekupsensis]OUD14208.1 carbonate dehydratase [Thioflexithrix psekupsensis]
MNIEFKKWHSIDTDSTISALNTNLKKGLSESEYQARIAHYGLNQLTPKKERSAFIEFLLQFHNPLVYILLVASIVTFLLKEYADSAVIFGVIFVNAIIGFVQESKAKKAIHSLKKMLNTKATVLRNGQKMSVLSSSVTLGDVILLNSGDKIPADMRLISVNNLKIDESMLTGESVAVEKRIEALSEDTVLADRINMAYAGTLVTYGQAVGVVTAIGDKTETGQIAHLINEATTIDTPLTKKITEFSKTLLWIIIGLALLTFFVGYFVHGQNALDLFMASVALAVAAIPEGLPAVVTITLAIGVRIMAHKNAIIRKLPAVETLGSTTVICSDKTGTLTKNEMTVTQIAIDDTVFNVTGNGYHPIGSFYINGDPISNQSYSTLAEILRCGMLCNDSLLIEPKKGHYQVQGDPTEGALLVSGKKYGFDDETLTKEHPRLDAIPFESDRMYMVTLHPISAEENMICIKGSLERLLQMSKQALNVEGNVIALSKEKIEKVAIELAENGLRVLAFSVCYVPKTVNSLKTFFQEMDQLNIHFLGVQAMIDPPRPEAIAAVALCQQAGIHVKMITGDHKVTALAVAKELGINTSANGLTGAEMSLMDDVTLSQATKNIHVFARVAPEQKLKLVSALQANRHIVAMTGDGVNDAPALKQADIGIAMGINGTEVSKEAADMVLADDNFASIAAAVEQGRGIFDNLIKFIAWILPTNVGQGLVIMLAVFLGTTLPVLPVHALWLNMTTALFLGLMLAFEPQESGVMLRQPRHVDEPILNTDIMIRIFLISFLLLFGAFGIFTWSQMQGASEAESRTLAVTLFVIVQSFYLLNCRSLTQSVFYVNLFSNYWIWIGIGLMFLAQLAFIYLPFMNTIFHSAPIALNQWFIMMIYGAVTLIIVDFHGRFMKRYSNGK